MNYSCRFFAAMAVFSLLFGLFLSVSTAFADSQIAGNSSNSSSTEETREKINTNREKEVNELLSILRDSQKREIFLSRVEALLELNTRKDFTDQEGFLELYNNLIDRLKTVSFVFLVSAIIQTVIVIIITWLATVIIKRLIKRFIRLSSEFQSGNSSIESRTNRYMSILHRLLNGLIILIAIAVILQAWDVAILRLLRTDIGIEIVLRFFTISAVIVVSLLFWAIANTGIDRVLSSATTDRSGARIRTLLPLARNALLVVVVLTALIIILSELGVNVAPLLAGAGVLGLAVGFGAQTLVKDIITGAFIVFENTLTVGDVVEVAGHSGVVEAMTIRTIRLRDLNGTVHTVPFSSVDTIINMTRDYAYVVAEVGVAYRENTDEVIELLRGVADELKSDEQTGRDIIGSLEVMGVDRFEDSAVMLRLRIKTEPGKQWSVQREFNRRIKYAFDKHGIEMPFPHTTIYFGENKSGEAPTAKISVKNDSDKINK